MSEQRSLHRLFNYNNAFGIFNYQVKLPFITRPLEMLRISHVVDQGDSHAEVQAHSIPPSYAAHLGLR